MSTDKSCPCCGSEDTHIVNRLGTYHFLGHYFHYMIEDYNCNSCKEEWYQDDGSIDGFKGEYNKTINKLFKSYRYDPDFAKWTGLGYAELAHTTTDIKKKALILALFDKYLARKVD